ncbi:class I SAM-dependent methyltransferase [Prosthecobacter sp. SYSU 5D2]|uniref:class I SAM-dependent methyltransferase n=1 Tax=Prosthecobacter sp. SYSU 5D2 TaxID=3134134 RepID=UPI0031FF3930
MTPTLAQLENIAALCDRRWDFFYTRSKLASDPVYQAVVREIGQSDLPVLDIGCGIGLLAHYLRTCGHTAPITGFDYDKRKITSAEEMVVKSGHQGLAFSAGDARTGLPDFDGHVVILDILQFFTPDEQNALLTAAAARVAPGGKLVIRTCLRDSSGRYKITVLGDYIAKFTFWMKDAPTAYPDAQQFNEVLSAAGLQVKISPLWGGTPFNNHLIVAQR